MNQLNIIPPDIRPRATESIDAIIELNKLIIKNGYGYVSNGSVYFDVSKYEDYDSIFMRKQVKDRTETAMYQYYMGTDQDTKKADFVDEKKSEKDFAIWKKAKEGEPTWESPWGPGRPGCILNVVQ
jgi:cysteinyl-tRNA synthetase